MRPLGVPPHLPRDRAEAIVMGVQGPTQDDVIQFNAKCKTNFVDFSQRDTWEAIKKSRSHDPDWFRAVRYPRLTTGALPSRQGLHAPGTFTGQWLGSQIVGSFVLVCDMILIAL